MRLLNLTRDSSGRAVSRAESTAAALFGIYHYAGKLFAMAGRAALFIDVSLVFIAEIAEGGKHRVGSRLAKTAKSGGLYGVCKLLQLFYIAVLAAAVGDALQYLFRTHGKEAQGRSRENSAGKRTDKSI